LCFERRFSKQNNVIRLRSNMFSPPNLWAGYATELIEMSSLEKTQVRHICSQFWHFRGTLGTPSLNTDVPWHTAPRMGELMWPIILCTCSNEVVTLFQHFFSSERSHMVLAVHCWGLYHWKLPALMKCRNRNIPLDQGCGVGVGVAKESEVFGWTRIPNNTRSRSRIFMSDSGRLIE